MDADVLKFGRDLVATMPRLLALGRRLAGNAEEARDLVQDTLEQAWISRSQFTPGTNLQAWLNRILRNRYLRKRERLLLERRRHRELAEAGEPYYASQESALALTNLVAALKVMPAPAAEAVILVAVGTNYHEAAVALGLKVGTLKSRVNRARRRLAEIVDGPPSAGAGRSGSAPAKVAVRTSIEDESAG